MYQLRAKLSAARGHFWVLPALAIVGGIAIGLALPPLDTHVTLPDVVAMSGQQDTARSALTAIIALGVSIAGVSFSVIAVALVLASQQFSPRVLRSFQRNPLNQIVLAMLLGTATYALFVLGAISDERGERVPELAVTLAMALAAASLAVFAIFLHNVVRSLNASSIIRRIAAEGHTSIKHPYPAGVGEEPDDPDAAELAAGELARAPCRLEIRSPRAGYLASVGGERILAWAEEHDVLVEQRRGVGSFVVTGGVLAVVHCDDSGAIDPDGVIAAFEIDEERLIDGDIAFPIRQLADVALRGLSPGINDPTTAENAMDSVTDTLVRFARRPPISALRVDADGTPRLRAIAPTLDDLVRLAFDQVRRAGAGQPSFALRLLELLADLRESAPEACGCTEIDRQARLIAEHAAGQAEHEHDHRMVVEGFERLHGDRAPIGVGAGGRGGG